MRCVSVCYVFVCDSGVQCVWSVSVAYVSCRKENKDSVCEVSGVCVCDVAVHMCGVCACGRCIRIRVWEVWQFVCARYMCTRVCEECVCCLCEVCVWPHIARGLDDDSVGGVVGGERPVRRPRQTGTRVRCEKTCACVGVRVCACATSARVVMGRLRVNGFIASRGEHTWTYVVIQT